MPLKIYLSHNEKVHMKAALNVISYLAYWQKFRSWTMVCVRLGENRLFARGSTPVKRNLLLFLVRNTYTHMLIFVQRSVRKINWNVY